MHTLARISAPQIRAFGFGIGQNGPSPSQSPSPSPAPSNGSRTGFDNAVSFPGFAPTYPQPFYNYPVVVDPVAPAIPAWGWLLGAAGVGVLAAVLLSK